MGMSEVGNCNEVIIKYLHIYMLVHFGEGVYTSWFSSSK